MRIAPDHPRLRIVAVTCWSVGSWLLIQPGLLSEVTHQLLAVMLTIGAVLVLALGVAFWLLGTDRRAGIVFDTKGIALNLGQSAAFVSWDNIAAIGVYRHRFSLLALGSRQQIGIELHRPAEYIQSYECRLPAARGPLAAALRLLRWCAHYVPAAAAPSLAELQLLRRRTGYHVIIPEAQLGGRAEAFLKMIQIYRYNPAQREGLTLHTAPGI